MIERVDTDVLVLGAGGAGLCAALHAADASPSLRVVVVVKGLLGRAGCTRMVQGGYNAVLAAPDSLDAHLLDTLHGGGWINDQELVWTLVTEAPVAILRVPDLHLEVPVFATDSELHLNRGAGLIAGMGDPDKGGNVGIAGHRDGFFRALKDVKPGQLIEIETRARTHRYRVVSTEIVDPKDVHVLEDTLDPTVTIVTCYPFYFLGSAPQRFIVRGAYEWT